MRKIIAALVLGVMTLGTTAGASAQVNVRQLNQERRIDAGARSGKLTRYEARRLRGEQHAIERRKTHLKARHGGHMTRRDKREVHMLQDRANRHLLNQKHDGQRGRNHLKL